MRPNVNITNILWIAFLIRFSLMLVNNYVVYLPHGDGDALGFERKAYLLSTSGYDIDFVQYIASGSRFFALISSFLYVVIGRQPLVLGFIMVLLGVWCVKLVHKASLLLFKDVIVAKKAAWIAALFPQFCLHSALLLREIPVNLFLLLSIVSFIKYWKYSQASSLLPFVFFGVMATLFHSGMLFIFIGLIMFNMLKSKKDTVVKVSFAKKYGLPVLVFSAVIVINLSGIGLSKFGGSLESATEQFETTQNYKTKGNSAYPQWMSIDGGLSDAWKVPIRFIAFLFAPLLPFMVKSVGHAVGLLDALIYLFFFYRMYKNRHFLKSNTTASAILIISLALSLVFSMGVTNVGTGIRHRAKIAPLFILLFIPIQRKITHSKSYRFK